MMRQCLPMFHLQSKNPAMQHVLRKVERAAKSPVAVLLEGEMNTGKETVARVIHMNSSRRAKPFVAIDCTAASEALEEVLFGARSTGRRRQAQHGKAVSAQGGVLFLANIQHLPLDAQHRLVRLIEAGEIETEPGRAPRRVDVRVIAATSERLIDLVRARLFREDLFYRLNVMTIALPPLRERPEDIPALADFLVMRFSAQDGRLVQRVDPAAAQLLMGHDWPGNWRELESVMFDAMQVCDGPEVTAVDLARAAFSSNSDSPSDALLHARQTTLSSHDGVGKNLSLFDPSGEFRPLAELEADIIRSAIDHYRSHMSEVSRRLGIGRSTLYRKLKELGIDDGAGIAV